MASLPCMQWFVVPAPRRPVGVDSTISVIPGPATRGRRIGDVTHSHATAGGTGTS